MVCLAMAPPGRRGWHQILLPQETQSRLLSSWSLGMNLVFCTATKVSLTSPLAQHSPTLTRSRAVSCSWLLPATSRSSMLEARLSRAASSQRQSV